MHSSIIDIDAETEIFSSDHEWITESDSEGDEDDENHSAGE
jgi:hypothetical protein